MAKPAAFRIAGFPVHVRPGFLIFLVLLVAIHGSEFGLWLAAGVAGFTLVHELGHAFVARRAGAVAEISLDFMMGFASYTPTRAHSRWQQATISFSGPAVHIAAGCAVLVAMGASPLDYDAVRASPSTAALWWAGPVIGLFNLIPVLPLDGGNIVTVAVERVAGERARHIMAWFSLAATAAAAVYTFVNPAWQTMIVFLGLLAVMQIQTLTATSPSSTVSVWDRAAASLESGDESKARRTMAKAFRRPTTGLRPPVRADGAMLSRLVDLLPDPIPIGDPWMNAEVQFTLLTLRRHRDAAEYAARCFDAEPDLLSATTVARAAAAIGDRATAVAWLQAAAGQATDERSDRQLAAMIDGSPEFAHIRQDPSVLAVRHRFATP